MAALSPAILAPAITYGGGSIYYNTSDSGTGNTNTQGYRVNSWPATSNIINWDGTTTTVEIEHTKFMTLDSPYAQYARGPGYTLRVVPYYNGDTIAATGALYYGDTGALYYGNTTSAWTYSKPKTAAERLKEILNNRMSPNILTTCRPLGYTQDIREMRARETLRRVLGEDKFKDFVRRGSVSVRAKSGLMYQIFPGSDFTKVYDSGKMIERLCVVLTGNFPPTDSLIMRYLLILNNEVFFRSKAIKHGIGDYGIPHTNPDNRSLVEIYRKIKRNAA